MKDEKVNATFSSYQKELITAVIIALIITSALSLYLSRSITKPILSLASAAERIKMTEVADPRYPRQPNEMMS